MNIIKNQEIQKIVKEIECQIGKDAKVELQNTFHKILKDILALAKKSVEMEQRKRIFPTDISKAVQMYGELKGMNFLDQLQISTENGFKEFFENKKQELEQWKN